PARRATCPRGSAGPRTRCATGSARGTTGSSCTATTWCWTADLSAPRIGLGIPARATYARRMTTTSHEATLTGGETTGAVEPPQGTDVTAAVHDVARRAKVASRALATATRATKDAALRAVADALVTHADAIVAANAEDLDRGRANGMTDGLLDRLALTVQRIASIADALPDVAGLPDPVGEDRKSTRLN